MRKITLIFSTLLFAFVFVSSVQGEEPVNWRASSCMAVERCKDTKADDDDPPEKKANECKMGTSWHINRLKLDQSVKPPSNSEAYLTECVQVSKDESYCTTADANLDSALPINGNLQALIDKIKYNVDESGRIAFYDVNGNEIGDAFSKLATDALGNLILPGVNKQIATVEWKSYNPGEILARSYKIWTPFKDSAGPADKADEEHASGIAGQQQDDLEFSYTEQTSECETVTYDPEGRVFDAVTLDPIPNVAVTLLQRDQAGNYTKEAVNQFNTEYTIINPYITNTKSNNELHNLAGSFSFYVVNGFYKLLPSHNDYNFEASASQSKLPVNANKVYSQIYFNDSQPIEQKGKIEHRDIPLFPKDGVGRRYPETFDLIWDSKETINPTTVEYKGQVTHPFAKAIVKICSPQGCREDRVISGSAQGGPNKDGEFNIKLDQSVLVEGEYYTVDFAPVDLVNTALSKSHSIWDKVLTALSSISFIKKVDAQETSVSRKIEPIFAYLEGYAYDKQGKIIPNAQISIYVPFAKGPMVQTKADANGYFRLTTEYLPKTSYSLAYNAPDKPNDKTNITTSQFLAQNKEFIAAEKIDPYLKTTRTSNPRRNVTPTFVPSGSTTVVPNPTDTALAQQPTQAPQGGETTPAGGQSNTVALVAAVLLLLLAAAGILLAVYLYKKRMAEGNNQV